MRLATVVSLAALAVLAFVSDASAQDQVTLQDNTLLEGRVLHVEHNFLVMTTPILGRLSIETLLVRSIDTAAPMHMLTSRGEWVTGAIRTRSDGTIQIEPVGGGNPVEIQWWNVAGIFPSRVRWANAFALGGSFTQGNTDLLGFSFSGTGSRKGETNRFFWWGSFTWARAQGTTVAQSANAALQFSRSISPRLYWWIAEELRYDKFQDLDIRSVTSGGLGYILISRPKTEMFAEAGVGYMAERFRQDDDQNNAAFRGAWIWEQLVGRTATFTNRFVTYVGGGSLEYQFTNQAAFWIDLTPDWRFKVTNGWYYDREPSLFVEHDSDVEWVVGFEYAF
jgi:hypothetical protein